MYRVLWLELALELVQCHRLYSENHHRLWEMGKEYRHPIIQKMLKQELVRGPERSHD
jgi:hypothetical protein